MDHPSSNRKQGNYGSSCPYTCLHPSFLAVISSDRAGQQPVQPLRSLFPVQGHGAAGWWFLWQWKGRQRHRQRVVVCIDQGCTWGLCSGIELIVILVPGAHQRISSMGEAHHPSIFLTGLSEGISLKLNPMPQHPPCHPPACQE